MSEFPHPPLEAQEETKAGIKLHVAQEAYALLTTFGDWSDQEKHDPSTFVSQYVTDRYNAFSHDTARRALRLRSVPTISIHDGETLGPEDSRSFLLIQLESGEADLAIDEPMDSEFSWKPYVSIIINTERRRKVHIVNPQTGENVKRKDLKKVVALLGKMREAYSVAHYFEGSEASYYKPRFSPRFGKYMGFEIDDELLEFVSTCHDCHIASSGPCLHTEGTQN